MENLLSSLTLWHWLILALLLLIGEALGAAGFMIGISLAAVIVSILMAFGLLQGWEYQFLVFALFSVINSALFWRFFRKQNEHDQAEVINDRAAQLIGRKLVLETAIENGQGRIQIGDTFWKVKSDTDLEKGQKVEITAAEGMCLLLTVVD